MSEHTPSEQEEPVQASPQAPADTAEAGHQEHTVERTRTSGMWTAVACAAIVLLLLLIFILQNQQSITVAFFGLDARIPAGVALLFAAVLGALVVVVSGIARILQLRLLARRHRRHDQARST